MRFTPVRVSEFEDVEGFFNYANSIIFLALDDLDLLEPDNVAIGGAVGGEGAAVVVPIRLVPIHAALDGHR